MTISFGWSIFVLSCAIDLFFTASEKAYPTGTDVTGERRGAGAHESVETTEKVAAIRISRYGLKAQVAIPPASFPPGLRVAA
ncbi:MAG: hypothetical protein HW414_1855 [Dehalococcoidia bacterium]|nr:hypothetical protein [Dehalococcoidia bacterium]